MVYCGQPSKACAECRLRRTKCDTLRPSCSQCLRSGRECTGYRDPADMIFRDESKVLLAKRERKVQGAKNGSSASLLSPSPSSPSSMAPRSQPDVVPPSNLDPALFLPAQNFQPKVHLMNLGSSAEEQAMCFFFRNYVLDSQQLNNGNFQYLSDIYDHEEVGPALSDCIAALGMVGLANFWKASNIMIKARSKYNSAIKLVSSRLMNIEEAKADQTLAAVMLLGLYETNTCNGPQSMKSWTKHINGAAALLSIRGRQQLSTSIGRSIFVHLRTQIITNCIQRHVEVPAVIARWSKIALQYETPLEATATRLSTLGIKFASIRASMASFRDHSNSTNIISLMCALDAQYIEWVTECPPECHYATIPLLERCDGVYGDYYHVYTNLWIATLWNHYRCMRILVNEILLDQASFLLQPAPSFDTINPSVLNSDFRLSAETSFPSRDPTYRNVLFTASNTVRSLSHDICSSVPFFISSNSSGSLNANNSPPKSVCGNLLLWPLYTAACTWLVSDMMRAWVARQLSMIADTMGVRLATPLAQSLKATLDLELMGWSDDAPGDDDEVLEPEDNCEPLESEYTA